MNDEPKLHKVDDFTRGDGGAVSIALILVMATACMMVCIVTGIMLILTVMPR